LRRCLSVRSLSHSRRTQFRNSILPSWLAPICCGRHCDALYSDSRASLHYRDVSETVCTQINDGCVAQHWKFGREATARRHEYSASIPVVRKASYLLEEEKSKLTKKKTKTKPKQLIEKADWIDSLSFTRSTREVSCWHADLRPLPESHASRCWLIVQISQASFACHTLTFTGFLSGVAKGGLHMKVAITNATSFGTRNSRNSDFKISRVSRGRLHFFLKESCRREQLLSLKRIMFHQAQQLVSFSLGFDQTIT